MKDKLLQIINSLTRRLCERVTPSQNSPVSSCCLTTLIKQITTLRVDHLRVVRHRFATTGEGFYNTFLKNLKRSNLKSLSLEWSTFLLLVRSWEQEEAQSNIKINQLYDALLQGREKELMYCGALNENWLKKEWNEIKNLDFNLCVEHKKPQRTKAEVDKNNCFRVLGEKLYRLADSVESEWNKFSENDKQKLIELAYRIIEPPKLNFFNAIHMKLLHIMLSIQGITKDVEFCADALYQLADNILNAVEHDDPSYESLLLDMLKEIKQNPEIGEIVTSGNISDRLKQLSDQAYRAI